MPTLSSITIPEAAAALAAYALALVQLLNAAQPLWSWIPKKLQPFVPALVMILPQFARVVGLARTGLDLETTVLMAIGALVSAMRGQPHPEDLIKQKQAESDRVESEVRRRVTAAVSREPLKPVPPLAS